MERQDEKRKPIPTRTFACCPVCSKTLIQAELVKNAVIKCEGCKNHIFIEIENGKAIAKPNN